MKRLVAATAVMLAVSSSTLWAQAPADPHHPPQGAAPVPAQPSPGQPGMMGGMPMMNMMGDMSHMMPMMRMMGMMGPGMATIDHVEGRIAFLRTELKITEAQASAWNSFADALRTNANRLGEVRASMMAQRPAGQPPAPTLAERLDVQERWLAARLEGTRTLKSALTNLYGVLSDDQKKTADELLTPHVGMGMMGMMPGPMQPGPMQPGGR
jgi:LTXXQ motif family protein